MVNCCGVNRLKIPFLSDRLKKAIFDSSPFGLLAETIYRARCRFRVDQMPKVLSMEKTLELIATTDRSVVRFGDGELAIMLGKDIGYQQASPRLSEELVDAMKAKDERLLICVPDVFSGMPEMVSPDRDFWVRHLLMATRPWISMMDASRTYGNQFISRPYMMGDKRDPRRAGDVFEAWKSVWRSRPVIIVEGEFTRFGVGNDILGGAASIRRVIGPATNAYSRLQDIMRACSQLDSDALYLLALGPAAKPLVISLMRSGRRAIDIGHLDVEYEWFLRASHEKTTIPGKAVNEAGTLTAEEVDESAPYHSEIVARIE